VLDALAATDILLTDVTLPGQSGLALAHSAREKFPDLRVIFATGRSIDGEALPGKVLLKPFSLAQLEAVLR
jgi:CheY-like chemotaxis protein